MEGWKEAEISFRGSSGEQAQNVGRQETWGRGDEGRDLYPVQMRTHFWLR